MFGDTLHCTNCIIVHRKEIYGYARIEHTHEAVSATKKHNKNMSIQTFRKESDVHFVSKKKRN